MTRVIVAIVLHMSFYLITIRFFFLSFNKGQIMPLNSANYYCYTYICVVCGVCPLKFSNVFESIKNNSFSTWIHAIAQFSSVNIHNRRTLTCAIFFISISMFRDLDHSFVRCFFRCALLKRFSIWMKLFHASKFHVNLFVLFVSVFLSLC